ncbi:16S rRNA (uracil(1498)-N(3))-methyltransferase [Thiolapillus sp.]
MRRPRNYLSQDLSTGSSIELPATVVRHLVQVLRMQAGQEIVLFNGDDGIDYQAVLTEVSKRRAHARILSAGNPEPQPKLQIHLAQGISRGERMDLALQKAVELGAVSITPLTTERTQQKLTSERLEKRMQHWQKIIISACEQSGRRRLPLLHPPQTVANWLKNAPKTTLFLDPMAQHCLKEIPPPGQELGLLIGPEGGFSDQETALAGKSGCTGIRLGPRVLRTETAPLAAIAAIQALWGDFC